MWLHTGIWTSFFFALDNNEPMIPACATFDEILATMGQLKKHLSQFPYSQYLGFWDYQSQNFRICVSLTIFSILYRLIYWVVVRNIECFNFSWDKNFSTYLVWSLFHCFVWSLIILLSKFFVYVSHDFLPLILSLLYLSE